jgi:hypothetical protein
MSTPFSQDVAQKVVSILLRAAETEAAGPRRKSQAAELSGVPQYESPNEKLERVLMAAVAYGLRQGLLAFPADIDSAVRNYLAIGEDLG